MTFETLEPVLNKENNPSWLTTDFELKKPGLYQCNKCGALNQYEENPLYCEDCKRNSHFQVVTERINPDIWKLPKWNGKNKKLDLKKLYDETLEIIKKLIVLSDEIEYKIFTLWIFSTWKLENWDSVGYPVFIGIPNSGKSRALRIMYYLAYRAIKSSGVSDKVIPRLTHYYNVTVLLDEAHNKLTGNPKSETNLLTFCKDSYKRGSTYTVSDNEDQKGVITYRNFGFKSFAGEKNRFDPGLLSRTIVFWMEKEDPEIAKIVYLEKELEEIRSKLLNYRYKTSNPKDLGNDFILKGRTREIFESIIATGKHIGIDTEDIIEYAKQRDIREEEKLRSSEQYEILAIIKKHEQNPTLDDAPNKILTDDILQDLDWLTDDKKLNNIKRQRLGFLLRDMGIDTKRTKEGRSIFFSEGNNNNRLKRLYRRYKLC